MRTDDKAAMIHPLFPSRRLMAVEAVDAILRVCRHLVLTNHRILQPRMALRALSRGPYEIGSRLLGLRLLTSAVHKKGGNDERNVMTTAMKTERQDIDSNSNGAEG